MASQFPYLGRGLQYPLKPGADGGFRKDVENERIIQSSIGVILGTRIGERVMRRDFGSNLSSLKHEPNGPKTWNFIREEIFRALQTWEPRIDRLRVDVFPSPSADPDGRFLLQISISYIIISSNVPGNLVYPFFLEN